MTLTTEQLHKYETLMLHFRGIVRLTESDLGAIL